MMGLHLSAAALVGLWLAVGEQALWTVVVLTGAVMVALVVTPPLALPRRPRVVAAARRTGRPVVLRALERSVVRRGPPSLLAA